MRCLNLLLIPVTAFLMWLTPQHGAEASETAVAPLRPSEILKCMPPTGEGWRMATSTAQDVPDAWPRTKAQRDFVLEVPQKTGAPVVVAKLRLTVIDTGCHPGTVARFNAAKPGDAQEGRESFNIASMPAFRKKLTDQKEQVEALYENRFLISATLEIVKTDAGVTAPSLHTTAEWIEKMDMNALASASAKKVLVDVSKDRSMTVEFLDEINPRRSSRSTWTFAVEIPKP
ncbi:MAG: hypothetical protein ACAI35_01645 [Candidatus Methylacidiphilales bacterium]|nr:hypothetical protein [Candidatus Methylacidiphilales bacterium]